MEVPAENVQEEQITAHTSSTVTEVRFPCFLSVSVCILKMEARFLMENVKHFAFYSGHEIN